MTFVIVIKCDSACAGKKDAILLFFCVIFEHVKIVRQRLISNTCEKLFNFRPSKSHMACRCYKPTAHCNK